MQKCATGISVDYYMVCEQPEDQITLARKVVVCLGKLKNKKRNILDI